MKLLTYKKLGASRGTRLPSFVTYLRTPSSVRSRFSTHKHSLALCSAVCFPVMGLQQSLACLLFPNNGNSRLPTPFLISIPCPVSRRKAFGEQIAIPMSHSLIVNLMNVASLRECSPGAGVGFHHQVDQLPENRDIAVSVSSPHLTVFKNKG